MKKLWLTIVVVVIAGTLMGGLVFAVATSPGRTPTTWHTVFDQYVEEIVGGPIILHQSVRATAPQNFAAGTFISYGDSSYFEMDTHYGVPEIRTRPAPFTGTLAEVRQERRPLPYPPRELWCVQFEKNVAGVVNTHIVFVGLHEDMFIADWAVHEGETMPFSAEFIGVLQAVGCDALASTR